MASLELENVRKTFKGHVALHGLSLQVEEGEIMCLLGPSGCGKTTTLRIVAGFEQADAGAVRIGGTDVSRVPAQKRDIGVVFQSYALFPHLTVEENVGFGLRMRGRAKAEIARAVGEALSVVRLEGLGGRYPRQLSGGQQQRVALARAIAIQPRLLLLDEPLSNLDAKLREEMREEIRRVQRAVGITTVFVTHDQTEALALADRLAVMDHGRLMQVDRPRTVYERPAHPFVAEFFGQANLLRGRVRVDGAGLSVSLPGGLRISGSGAEHADGESGVVVIKHERLQFAAPDEPGVAGGGINRIDARIESRTYLGPVIQYTCRAAGQEGAVLHVARANAPGERLREVGEAVTLRCAAEDCLVLPDRD